MIRTIRVRIYVAPLWRGSIKRVAWIVKLILPIWSSQGYMRTCHGKGVQRNWHGGHRIHGSGVIGRIGTHMSVRSWKSIAWNGFVRGEVSTSHCESWLRYMTHIKRRQRNQSHGSPRSNDNIHINELGRGLQGWRHINRRMTRDPRRGLSAIVLHTIMKRERIRPHEMSGNHGVGSGKWGSKRTSTLHDNNNLV